MVYIDGKRASKQYVYPGKPSIIKGFKDHSARREAHATLRLGICLPTLAAHGALTRAMACGRSSAPFREFLFSLPRRVRGSEAADAEQLNAAQKAALAAALESIRVELFLVQTVQRGWCRRRCVG